MAREYAHFNKRIQAEKRWDAFKLHREAVKRILPDLLPPGPDNGKQTLQLAWRVASFRFQPLDNSPHEIQLTDQIAAILKGDTLPMIDQVAPLPEVDCEFWLDGDPDRPADAEPPPIEQPKYTPESLGLPEPPKLGKYIVYEQGMGKETVAAQLNRKEMWNQFHAQVDRSKRCKPYDMIQWVFEHQKIPPHLIDLDGVPSAGAAAYLEDVQESPSIRAEFMKTLYAKTIPDKKQMEHEGKQRDDGRQQLKLLDSFDEEWDGMEERESAA